MATCKYCGRSGFFLSVSKDGLCNSCSPIVLMDVQNKLRIINDSSRIIDESKNLKTKLSRCALIIQMATELLDYENKGIKVINPTPSVFIETYKNNRDEIILESIKQAIERAISKTKLAVTTKTKINELNKVLLLIQENKDELMDSSKTDLLEKELLEKKHKIQLDGFLEEAKKAAFKGQKKKALDQYKEALYFLKTDDIDDNLQKGYIKTINQKITELS